MEEKPVLEGFIDLMECGVASTVSNPKFPRIETILNEELGQGDVRRADCRRGARQRRRSRPRPDPRPLSRPTTARDERWPAAQESAASGRTAVARGERTSRDERVRRRMRGASGRPTSSSRPGCIIFSVFTLRGARLRVLADLPPVEHHRAGEALRRPAELPRTCSHDERFGQSIINTVLLHRRLGAADDGHRAAAWRCCSTSRSAAAALLPHAVLPAGRHAVRGRRDPLEVALQR